MKEYFEAANARNIRQYQVIAEAPCELVISYEDTSTTVMSKDMFVNFTAPAINEYADILHKANKKFITHMCGKVSGFIDEIGAGRQDGIDSLCPPTTGDLCANDARAVWGNKRVIIGGIEPPSLSRFTVDETIENVKAVIKSMANNNGFILSTGDAVPYGTPIENLVCISHLIKELGYKSVAGEF